MDVVYPVCCGIDVHQAHLTACLRRVQEDGHVTKDVQEFATTYPALLILLDWLIAQHCPVVALESTGVYWKPVYHVLAGSLEVLVGNAQDMQQQPRIGCTKCSRTRTSRWRVSSPISLG